MTNEVEARVQLDLTLTVSGRYVPGVGATPPSYAHGGDPPEGDCVEDVEVVSLGIEWFGSEQLKSHDLLAGVNRASPDIQRMFQNILAACSDEVHDAIMDASEE